MTSKFTVPRGTYDILPKESYKWEYIEQTFRSIVKNYNYQEIVTPIFENAEIFERSVGNTSDIIQKEMYKFQDKKGRVFALRPEGTAPVIRSYIENNLWTDSPLTKLFYVGPMFRYDRPQAGRSRQFSQFGIECIGSNHPYYDAEVISIFYNFLKAIGLKKYQVEINSIGCPNCSENYNEALRTYYKEYINQLCPDCKSRFLKNPKRLLDCKVDTCKKISKNAPLILDYLDEECKKHFEQVQFYLNLLKVPFIINASIVRGLDYYSQTAFEFINNNLGAQNALGGGGRYNGLIKQMGGKDIPAVGFAGGFSRLLLSIENENIKIENTNQSKFFIVNLGDSAIEKTIEILNFLRKNNIKADFDIEKTSLKAQMKLADKLNSTYTIIIGEDEMKNNEFTIRNMLNGSQQSINFDNIKALLEL